MTLITYLPISQIGNSALMEAAYWVKTDIAVELVKAGANLDLQNNVRIQSAPAMYMYVRVTSQSCLSINKRAIINNIMLMG